MGIRGPLKRVGFTRDSPITGAMRRAGADNGRTLFLLAGTVFAAPVATLVPESSRRVRLLRFAGTRMEQERRCRRSLVAVRSGLIWASARYSVVERDAALYPPPAVRCCFLHALSRARADSKHARTRLPSSGRNRARWDIFALFWLLAALRIEAHSTRTAYCVDIDPHKPCMYE